MANFGKKEGQEMKLLAGRCKLFALVVEVQLSPVDLDFEWEWVLYAHFQGPPSKRGSFTFFFWPHGTPQANEEMAHASRRTLWGQQQNFNFEMGKKNPKINIIEHWVSFSFISILKWN